MADVPPEIVADILSRLPVKPLLRFRCVSKPWCALIDSSNFIKMHLNRSIQTKSSMSIILTYTEQRVYSIDFDLLDRAVGIDHPFGSELHPCGPALVWGSCNGLLCLVNSRQQICVWNPSTRKHWKLPFSLSDTLCPVWINRTFVYGFGFDSMSDDYKVVRIVLFRGEERMVLGSEVKVYSLKSNTWRRVGDFPHQFVPEIMPGQLASGALHWAVAMNPKDDEPDSFPCSIIAFDLGVEGFQIVTQPDYKFPNFYLKLGVLEGCLFVRAYYYRQLFDIWMMEEYGVKESWAKLISIKQSDLGVSVYNLMPIAFSKNCGKVLIQDDFEDDTQRFSWYDLRRKITERVKICDIPYDFRTFVCWSSLVPLGGHSGSYGKKQRAKDKAMKKNNTEKRDDFLSEGFKLAL